MLFNVIDSGDDFMAGIAGGLCSAVSYLSESRVCLWSQEIWQTSQAQESEERYRSTKSIHL